MISIRFSGATLLALSLITAAPADEPDSAIAHAPAGQLSRRGLLAGAGALVLALSLKPKGAIAAEKGFGADGMPVGLQLIGNYLQEARLLNVAHQLQCHTDWHQQRPALASKEVA